MTNNLIKLSWNPEIEIPLPKTTLDNICQKDKKDELGIFVFLTDLKEQTLFNIAQYKEIKFGKYELYSEKVYSAIRELRY